MSPSSQIGSCPEARILIVLIRVLVDHKERLNKYDTVLTLFLNAQRKEQVAHLHQI